MEEGRVEGVHQGDSGSEGLEKSNNLVCVGERGWTGAGAQPMVERVGMGVDSGVDQAAAGLDGLNCLYHPLLQSAPVAFPNQCVQPQSENFGLEKSLSLWRS